jgi:hypothetical protein
LQPIAWSILQQEYSLREVVGLQACAERKRTFIAPYAAYVRDVLEAPRIGRLRAWSQWAK